MAAIKTSSLPLKFLFRGQVITAAISHGGLRAVNVDVAYVDVVQAAVRQYGIALKAGPLLLCYYYRKL